MQTPTRPELPTDGSHPDGRHRVEMAPAPMRKKTPVWIPIALIAALLGAGLFLKSRAGKPAASDKQAGPTIRTVKVVPVSVTPNLVSNIFITGQLKSNNNVNLSSKISGLVRQVYVNEGDRVKVGQLLVQLDDADLRQQVDAARANLESAQVKLQQTQLNLPSRLSALQSAVSQAQAQLQNAQANTRAAQARYQQAVLQQPATITTTKSQLDVAKAGVRSAQAAFKAAQDTARQTAQSVRANIAQAQAALAQAQAQYRQTLAGNRNQQLLAAQAQLRLAEAQRDNAQRELARQQTLAAGGATAQVNVETAQTQLQVAQAQVDAQQQNVSLVETTRPQEVTAALQVVGQREAALQAARADQNRVLAAQSQVAQALEALNNAQQQVVQAVGNQANIPATQQATQALLQALNQARAQENLQRAALQQAQSNLSQAPGLQADVPAARAAVAQAQAQLEQAQVNLGYARIVSPVNGIVATKYTDAGQSAGPGTTLLNLVALDSTIFEAQIPESQLAQVKVGQPTRVTVSSISQAPIIGYVSEIIPVADARLRQFRIRIRLPQSDRLTPGAFARGQLQTQVVKNALTVPDETVRTDEDQPYVYVAKGSGDDAKVQKSVVKTGLSANGKTQIVGGVQAGDKIILGNAIFDDNTKVKTVAARPDDLNTSGDGGLGSGGSSSGSGGSGGARSGGAGASGAGGASASGAGGAGASGAGGAGAGAGAGGSGGSGG